MNGREFMDLRDRVTKLEGSVQHIEKGLEELKTGHIEIKDGLGTVSGKIDAREAVRQARTQEHEKRSRRTNLYITLAGLCLGGLQAYVVFFK